MKLSDFFRKSMLRRKARRITREYPARINSFELKDEGKIDFANWDNPLVSPLFISQEMVDFFKKFIKKGDLVIDIGANTGDTQKIYLATTKNQGDTWSKLNEIGEPANMIAKEGEAFFASSGTNIKIIKNHFAFVTGGKSSRLFYAKKWNNLSLKQGLQSTGANSIAINKNKHGVIVGGDFTADNIPTGNCVLFEIENNNLKLSNPIINPHGYRSCVIYINDSTLITCGTSGIDISKDGGKNWELISKESFHVVQKSKNGYAVYLAGGNGRIAKLIN